jgi:hypothetical protein
MNLLPAVFADLEPFTGWCLPTEAERYAKRLTSTMDEMVAFYDAITSRAEAALDYCDQLPLDALPDDARHLLWLLESMVMVSFPVELWRQPRVPDTATTTLDCVHEPVP